MGTRAALILGVLVAAAGCSADFSGGNPNPGSDMGFPAVDLGGMGCIAASVTVTQSSPTPPSVLTASAQVSGTRPTWYLSRALEKWKDKDDPVPFALAEYNAGASRVDRWIAATGVGPKADAHDFLNAMDFPTTRRYVDDIMARQKFYRLRGGL